MSDRRILTMRIKQTQMIVLLKSIAMRGGGGHTLRQDGDEDERRGSDGEVIGKVTLKRQQFLLPSMGTDFADFPHLPALRFHVVAHVCALRAKHSYL